MDDFYFQIQDNPVGGKGEKGNLTSRPNEHKPHLVKNYSCLGPWLKKTYLDKQREEHVLSDKVGHLAPAPLGKSLGHDFLNRSGFPYLKLNPSD